MHHILIAESIKVADRERKKLNDGEQHKMNEAEQHKVNDAEQNKMTEAEQNGEVLMQICRQLNHLQKFTLILKSNRRFTSVYNDKQNNLKLKLLFKTIIVLLVKIFHFP